MILLVQLNDTDDLIVKGKGNRDGLVQQIITYVKDGKTVTRKQWVRSEFADHAKKNEEEKKKTILKEEQREEENRARKLAEANEKARNADKRAHKKVVANREEMEEKAGVTTGVGKHHISEYKKKLKKLRKEEADKHKEQTKKNKTHAKKEDKRSAFGQQDSTRKQNKDEENLITRPNV